jgi:hypothetical protein
METWGRAGVRRSPFTVHRSAFGVRRLAFGVWRLAPFGRRVTLGFVNLNLGNLGFKVRILGCTLGWERSGGLAYLLFLVRRFPCVRLGLYNQRPNIHRWLFPLARLLPEKGLGVNFLSYHSLADVRWRGPLLAGVDVVVPIDIQDLIYPLTQLCVLYWQTDFDAPEKIPRRPVRAGQINFRVACVFETINAAVF